MSALGLAKQVTLDAEAYRLTQGLQALLQSSAGDEERLFSLTRQLCDYLLGDHQDEPERAQQRARLAPWQERRAKELLTSSLSGRLYIAEVAQQCAMSRSHFSRAFKQSTGLSPQDWVLNLRIETAQHLLSQSNRSLTEIGQDCGFCDQAHFTRTFNRLLGVSPNRWRQARRPVCASGIPL
ncbi:Transcriptional regulator, AraC family [Pseudomonas sp. 8Z]|uniref:helix-turn-helix domain-containing protein n=1 Tax=Pseudomonas sp. 8Z TaxID=2653166 RepID=UPI0012F39898|nr:AraC family transcriptional regulator [Pseudomonas sp. 8Z]VXC73913.1 Transcriptional regulator, AraC family [Pseudomonas sp. 8Z]